MISWNHAGRPCYWPWCSPPCCTRPYWHNKRQNLNIRMHNRRFTRLTNAFSKKAENHARAFALQTLHHNFARIHRTLRVAPAMEAGIAEHVWSLEEMVGLLDTAGQERVAS